MLDPRKRRKLITSKFQYAFESRESAYISSVWTVHVNQDPGGGDAAVLIPVDSPPSSFITWAGSTLSIYVCELCSWTVW